MGLTPWIDVSCHLHCSQALNHLVRYVLMTPFGWFSGFSFLTQCLKLKTLVASQILTKIFVPVIIFNRFSPMVGQTIIVQAYYLFGNIVWNIFLLLWAQPEIYIQSAPNNSNETNTFMCLARASRFGQH